MIVQLNYWINNMTNKHVIQLVTSDVNQRRFNIRMIRTAFEGCEYTDRERCSKTKRGDSKKER